MLDVIIESTIPDKPNSISQKYKLIERIIKLISDYTADGTYWGVCKLKNN